MTSVQAVVLSALISVCLATPAIAKEKKSTGSARSAPAGKPAAGKGPQWMEKSDPKGFTIKVPWESKEERDEWSTTYAVVLAPDSTRLKTVVSVEALDDFTPVTSLDKAVESISRRPGALKARIAEQEELPDGYLVVVGPEYDIYTVHVIRNGKEIQVKAQCSGPAPRLALLKEMCLSVKPTK